MEFPRDFRGLIRIIALEASSHSWPAFVGFSWNFRGPTKNETSGKIGGFSWPFRGRPTALENTQENIFLSQAPPQ